ncbi:MAG: hypothetical protein LBU91_01160, partial [Bacteroidales bacterium]|nr:hypothetical protein [Bacteroidales bacterium]
MKLIETYKTFLWSLRMRKIANKQKRRRQMIGLDLAKSVGIYFYYDGKKTYETVNELANFLRNRGITVVLLAYCNHKEKPADVTESPNFGLYTKSKLGFNRVPNDDIVNMFVKQPFDIFFDLSLTDDFQNLYIANTSPATFKVGRPSEWGFKIFDFTLDVKGTSDLNEFIIDILKYFEVFNQNFEVFN